MTNMAEGKYTEISSMSLLWMSSQFESKMQHLEIVPSFFAQLDGKILPNAHAVVDVDGDDLHDFVFGTMNGVVAVFKVTPERLTKWKECRVEGCVSAICADANMPNDMRIFVATADGSCHIIQATESGDDFYPSSEFKVAMNVSDVILFRGFLIFGTRDGTVTVYAPDTNALGGHRMVHTHDLGVEVEAFQSACSDAGELSGRLVRCTTGQVFILEVDGTGKISTQQYSGPKLSTNDGSTPFIVDAVRSPSSTSTCTACGSLAGRVELRTSSDQLLWAYELPEAVIGMDRIPVTADSDAIVVCTWSGNFYVIQDPHRIAQFRMILPASSMFGADMLVRIDRSMERIVVGISTSGVISIYRGLQNAVIHAMDHTPLLERVHSSSVGASIDTDDKRHRLLKKLLEHTDQSRASELSQLLTKSTIATEDLIHLATSQRW